MSYLNSPPPQLSFIPLPHSWNSFNMPHFSIYICTVYMRVIMVKKYIFLNVLVLIYDLWVLTLEPRIFWRRYPLLTLIMDVENIISDENIPFVSKVLHWEKNINLICINWVKIASWKSTTWPRKNWESTLYFSHSEKNVIFRQCFLLLEGVTWLSYFQHKLSLQLES
jgi:hypothetical protein